MRYKDNLIAFEDRNKNTFWKGEKMLLIVLILIYVILLHIQLILLVLGAKDRDKLISKQAQIISMQDEIIEKYTTD